MGRGNETYIDGKKFSSEIEAWAYMNLRDRNLNDFKLHPNYLLFPKGTRQIHNEFEGWNGNSRSAYTADFSYVRKDNGDLVIVEVKPPYIKPADSFRLRCRVFLQLYPDLTYLLMSCTVKKPTKNYKPLPIEELYRLQCEGEINLFSYNFHWYIPAGKVYNDYAVW